MGLLPKRSVLPKEHLMRSTNYAKERVQFGKPISAQQGVGFKLADMATSIEASRLLTYQAAWLESVGLPYGKESGNV